MLVLCTATSAPATVRYVGAVSASPAPPYTNWVTAARTIQEAVDAADLGDEIVVTNGTFATGGRAVGTNVLVNRVAVEKPLIVRSVNGPEFTVIYGCQVPGTTNGDGAIRCVYLADGARFSGFTLTNGVTRAVNDYHTYWNSGGGGLWCESSNAVVSNCVLVGNSAYILGGGVSGGILNNCTLSGNSTSGSGGGANGGTLNNSIVYFNTAPNGANHIEDQYYGVLNYCCTIPLPTNGVGNITNAPVFVDDAGGNLRLQSNSPCINAGRNAYAPGPTDLDGNPRIVSGTVDIGAYEYQGSGSMVSYAWLQQFGLPTDGSADASDPDADGHNTWQEWRCLTDPTNALSVLRLLSGSWDGIPQGGMTVTWQSVAGVNCFLECSTNLSATPCFMPLASNLPGEPGITAYTDTNAVGNGPFFYRIGVQDP